MIQPAKRRKEDLPGWRGWLHQPAPRIWVAVLFIGVLVGAGLAVWTAQQNLHRSFVDACHRANDVRKESNRRIAEHVQDALDVEALSNALANTRSIEDQVWRGIRVVIIPPPKTVATLPLQEQHLTHNLDTLLKQLIVGLGNARVEDALIAQNESSLRFDPLRIVDCSKAEKP